MILVLLLIFWTSDAKKNKRKGKGKTKSKVEDYLKTFEKSKDVVFFTRAEEVVVFGCFKDFKSKAAKTFKKVAKGFVDSGIKFGMGMDPTIWKRFDNLIDMNNQYGVVLLVNFYEDGERRKRGRDKKSYPMDLEFSKKKLRNWIIDEAIPPVVQYPDVTKHGVDEGNRWQLVMSVKRPKLFCFREKGGKLDQTLSKIGRNNKGTIIIDIDAGHPDASNMVENFQPEYNEGFFAAYIAGTGRAQYDGKLNEFDLQKFLEDSRKGKTEL